MARRPYAAPLALALALTLVGCSEDSPAPKAAATPSTPATSATPTTEAPERLGPVQTVRAWVEAYNALVATGEADEVRAITARNCRNCENLFEPVLATHENGGRYDDPGWEIVDAQRHRDWPRDRTVAAAIRFPAGRVWSSEDAKPESYDREDHVMSFALREDGDRWLVADVVFLE